MRKLHQCFYRFLNRSLMQIDDGAGSVSANVYRVRNSFRWNYPHRCRCSARHLYGSWNVFYGIGIFRRCSSIGTLAPDCHRRPHSSYDDIRLIHSYWFGVDSDAGDNNDGNGRDNRTLFSTVGPFDDVHFLYHRNLVAN